MGEIFHREVPAVALTWTGERLTTETSGQVEIEHLHRYFFARSLCRGLDVLDVASGEGYGSALLAQVAKSVVGVEIAVETVGYAQAAYRMPNLTFLQGDARRIPCADDSFDAVVSFETLEHFYEHEAFLAEVRRVLRPGGMFIISSPERDVYSPAGGTPNPYHVRELTHSEFSALLRSNFQQVSMYAQRPLLGSALMVEEFGAQPSPLLTFERRDQSLFEVSVGLPRPIYLVAVASDAAFVPNIGSLYVETSGIEAIFAAASAARQEIRSLTERLVQQGEYAQAVQAELNQRDAQLATKVAEAQDWHRQLVQRNEAHEALGKEAASLTERLVQRNEAHEALGKEAASLTERLVQQGEYAQAVQAELKRRDAEYAALVETHAALLQRRADRFARREAALHADLRLRHDQQAEIEALRAIVRETDARLHAVLLSTSWRLTGPLRGVATRHPTLVANLHGVVARHPKLRRIIARSARGAWRTLTLRSLRNAPPPPALRPEPAMQPGNVTREPPPLLAPAEDGQVFQKRPITPALASVPRLPSGGRRRALCIGHVLPYPPRAGNEYRIHKLLSWLANDGWDLLVVVCPLPHEMPSAEQLASAASVYPNLIVVDHTGTLFHHLTDYSPVLDALRPRRPADIPALLHEDAGGDPVRARTLGLLRSFCPDVFVELLLQLQDIYQPNLLLAEYIFMTRPFALLRPDITTAIDTIDVFSTKAQKVEKHGVSDGLAMTEAEEADLLRRADILIGIQAEEAQDLARLAPDCKTVSIPVDFPVSAPGGAARTYATLLLVASGNPMNVNGLQGFLDEAWPIVRRNRPDAELVIVGAVGASVDPIPEGIQVLGKVEDLRPLYAAARLVINPTAAGTGLKIKTVEALCHLRPVVCWPSGVDGVAAEARRFCSVATDWPSFAGHVTRLLEADAEAFAVEQEHDVLQRLFSAETVYAPLREVLNGA
jgi:SAM-dependent methyltransferase